MTTNNLTASVSAVAIEHAVVSPEFTAGFNSGLLAASGPAPHTLTTEELKLVATFAASLDISSGLAKVPTLRELAEGAGIELPEKGSVICDKSDAATRKAFMTPLIKAHDKHTRDRLAVLVRNFRKVVSDPKSLTRSVERRTKGGKLKAVTISVKR